MKSVENARKKFDNIYIKIQPYKIFDIIHIYIIILAMSKYIVIHKIINASIFMLFPIAAFIILAHKNITSGFNLVMLILLNVIEIGIFISFIAVSARCDWGTRKQHAIVKAVISLLIYVLIILFTLMIIIF
ncbi:hypothetical protein BPP43_11735 [Brachyspira pilosicoli P43/6/78]|nr:hypothetical protein BPP43_11735 [Brachyspira pilosicoli P43/6/78]